MKTIYSIIITEEKISTDRQRWKVCKNISRNYPAVAYRHSHQSNRKGGFENPHIHLVVAIPEDKLSLWLDGLLGDLKAVDKYQLFSTSARHKWEKIKDLRAYVNYISGDARKHTPTLAYRSSDWNSFVQEYLSTRH